MRAKEEPTAHSRNTTAVDPRVAGARRATDDNGAKDATENAEAVSASEGVDWSTKAMSECSSLSFSETPGIATEIDTDRTAGQACGTTTTGNRLKSRRADVMLKQLAENVSKSMNLSPVPSDDCVDEKLTPGPEEGDRDAKTPTQLKADAEEVKSRNAGRLLAEMSKMVSEVLGLPPTDSDDNENEIGSEQHTEKFGSVSSKRPSCSARSDSKEATQTQRSRNADRLLAQMSQKVSEDLGLLATDSDDYGTEPEEMSDESTSAFLKSPAWSEDEESEGSTEEPWSPDTFFGKLHQNSPLAYTAGEEWRPRLAAKEESDSSFPGHDLKENMENEASTEEIKWLYAQSFHAHERKQMVVEALPEYSLIVRDESEEEPKEQQAPAGASPRVDHPEELDATTKELQRLQLKEAIPECCLTDSVFLVDKPKTAVSLGFKLPSVPFGDVFQDGAYLKIRVCHVYSPFQFWFHLVNHVYDTAALNDMHISMKNVYIDQNLGYMMALPGCLLKTGYVCAIPFEGTWRRARIFATPPPGVYTVSIYYLDYGYGADVSAADLRYLPSTFRVLPELAFRGTLSYVYPLGPHWSAVSTDQFQRLVVNEELFAHVTELDLEQRIVFMRISQNKEFNPSINKMLIEANLAGKSRHYDPRSIENNLGRRQRYLRELLPSHEMLETRAFPVLGEEFETEFDCVLYSPSFAKFKVPRLTEPYNDLWQALVAWMQAYRKETEQWDCLYSETTAIMVESQRAARKVWLKRNTEDERKVAAQIEAMHKRIKALEETVQRLEERQ